MHQTVDAKLAAEKLKIRNESKKELSEKEN
jgi:hypothetical protein